MSLTQIRRAASALLSLAIVPGMVPVITAEPGPSPAPVPRGSQSAPDDPATPGPYRMTGTVRIEGSGEPVGGAVLDVMLSDSGPEHRGEIAQTETGPDGRFSIALPPGNARAWILRPPPGYWMPDNMDAIQSFVLTPDRPTFEKDYVVRRGTSWPIRATLGVGGEPAEGAGANAFLPPQTQLLASADDNGRLLLTLPTEGGEANAYVSRPGARGGAELRFRWDEGFRPDAVASVDVGEGGSTLIDAEGRSATVEGDAVDPVVEDGRLTLLVPLPTADPDDFGRLEGLVVDAEGRPVEGASVALALASGGGSAMSGPRSTTDAEGRFAIDEIPTTAPDGSASRLIAVVMKDGHAGFDGQPFVFEPDEDGAHRLDEPIRLEPAVAMEGRVVDPDGLPVSGAWISPNGGYALRARFTRTDEQGQFRVEGLPRGMVSMHVTYGDLIAGGKYVADGEADPVEIRLRPTPPPPPASTTSEPPAAPPGPPAEVAVGQPAPELAVGPWSDGQARSLEDFRGNVVFLDFWGIWCGPCVKSLPALEELKARYEPQGVVFLSVHTPGESAGSIDRLLRLEDASLLYAIDHSRGEDDGSFNGQTAERYGVRGYPTIVLIDPDGRIASRSDDPANLPVMMAIVEELGLDPKLPSEEDVNRMILTMLGRQIEAVLVDARAP